MSKISLIKMNSSSGEKQLKTEPASPSVSPTSKAAHPMLDRTPTAKAARKSSKVGNTSRSVKAQRESTKISEKRPDENAKNPFAALSQHLSCFPELDAEMLKLPVNRDSALNRLDGKLKPGDVPSSVPVRKYLASGKSKASGKGSLEPQKTISPSKAHQQPAQYVQQRPSVCIHMKLDQPCTELLADQKAVRMHQNSSYPPTTILPKISIENKQEMPQTQLTETDSEQKGAAGSYELTPPSFPKQEQQPNVPPEQQVLFPGGIPTQAISPQALSVQIIGSQMISGHELSTQVTGFQRISSQITGPQEKYTQIRSAEETSTQVTSVEETSIQIIGEGTTKQISGSEGTTRQTAGSEWTTTEISGAEETSTQSTEAKGTFPNIINPQPVPSHLTSSQIIDLLAASLEMVLPQVMPPQLMSSADSHNPQETVSSAFVQVESSEVSVIVEAEVTTSVGNMESESLPVKPSPSFHNLASQNGTLNVKSEKPLLYVAC